MIKKRTRKTLYGILSGLTLYAIVGSGGLYMLLHYWPAYAKAARDKSYTFEMLLSRLTVGIFAAVFAGTIATKVANDRGKSAWIVGAFIFCVAGYVHFFRVWADYPIWYHFAYLLPIIPVTGLSHYLFAKGNRDR